MVNERKQFEEMVKMFYELLLLYVSNLFLNKNKTICKKFLKTVFLMAFWIKVHQQDEATQKKYLYRLCDEFADRLKQEEILEGVLTILSNTLQE